MTSTTVPPLENRPKATPVLRTCTSSMPGRNLCCSPGAIDVATVCLVSWSSPTTTARTIAARMKAPRRVSFEPSGASVVITICARGPQPRSQRALDRRDDHGLERVQHDDRHHGREIEHAHGGDEAAKQAQVGL